MSGFDHLCRSKDQCLDLTEAQGLLEKINAGDPGGLLGLGIRPGVSGKEDYFAAIILPFQPAIDFDSARFAGAQVDIQDREGGPQYLRCLSSTADMEVTQTQSTSGSD
jgi:hypothetical protein